MFVVVALGGNALLQRGESMTPEAQKRNVTLAAEVIAELAKDHRLVVTHGNGPQVGLLAEQGMQIAGESRFPLDVIGAESQGMIGYVIERELSARLPSRKIATLLTQVVVDAADPAFSKADKPIGRTFPEADMRRLSASHGWSFVREGEGFRRAVPSPLPCQIREIDTIRILVDAGVIVICAGGGGVPVVIDSHSGGIIGVEAVVDKDWSAALLATELGADTLLILTDVAAAYTDWGTPSARAIRHATPLGLSRHRFMPGSMGPKIEAACQFASATGGTAHIGALAQAVALLREEAGTHIGLGGDELSWY
jgi:carbamate kinase